MRSVTLSEFASLVVPFVGEVPIAYLAEPVLGFDRLHDVTHDPPPERRLRPERIARRRCPGQRAAPAARWTRSES